MRFLMMVKANQNSEAGMMPDDKMIAQMMKYNDQLAKAGVLVELAGLRVSAALPAAARRRRRCGNRIAPIFELDDFAPSEAIEDARRLEQRLARKE